MNPGIALCLICLGALTGAQGLTRRGQQDSGAIILAKDQPRPAAIGLDDMAVYWIAEYRSAIHRVNKSGGAVTAVVTNQESIRRMIVDGNFIYFLTNKEIRRVRKTGGNAITLITFADFGSAEVAYWRLAVDKNNVYFVGGSKDDQLIKVSKNGGKPLTLAKVFLPSTLASDNANVYWGEIFGELKRVRVDGGEAVTIGECEKPAAVAVDATNVYCATELGRVFSFAKSNNAMKTIANLDNVPFDQLAVDERNVYALSLITGIYRIGKRGGRPERLVPLDRVSAHFAIDGRNLYWSNYDEGTVMRRRK